MTNASDTLLSQASQSQSTDPLGSKDISQQYCDTIRKAAAEGIVMLKNNGVLPIANGIISVFGRVQYDYFYVGNGSGGDVKSPYKINLLQGLDNNPKLQYNKALAEIYTTWCKANIPPTGGWGTWPTHYEEMPVTAEIVTQARSQSDIAIVIIGRSAGEDRDSFLEEGSFFLTKAEEAMLDAVAKEYDNDKLIVIINSGNIIDFSWYEKYEDKIGALLYVWQGGMESGNAVCDVLCGDENPSGKLTTAIAKKYDDYPTAKNFGDKEFTNYIEDIYVGYRYFETFTEAYDSVLFPFGYGLSYTSFSIPNVTVVPSMTVDKKTTTSDKSTTITVKVTVQNTGKVAGAEVIQVYYCAPQGLLGKPTRQLVAFCKTPLIPPDSQETVELQFALESMASYDDSGVTGYKSAYVLEAGEYGIYVGNSVRSAKKYSAISVDSLTVCCQLQEAAAAANAFKRIIAKENLDGSISQNMEDVPLRTVSLKERIIANFPKEIPLTGDKGYKLSDVVEGNVTLEAFVAQLNMEELEGLTRGDYIMNSPLGTPGNAGVFGGVTQQLRDKGVLPITTSDGPSGVRLQAYCAQLPCGLALASTWNIPLLINLATYQGEELATKGSHVLLAPGMNILRNPLCGRNFEYFSEDPLLSGKVAAAMVIGLQKHGKSACPKHYVCNNQEQFRRVNDSRVSERALREIYLKGFEICVKEAKPRNLMTSYNKINGVWGHYHYELCTTILRGEWGYEGNVVTDWWMQESQDPDFPDVYNDGYRVRAQVDVLMPGSKTHLGAEGDDSLLDSFNKENGISLAEIQRSAMHVLRFVLSVV